MKFEHHREINFWESAALSIATKMVEADVKIGKPNEIILARRAAEIADALTLERRMRLPEMPPIPAAFNATTGAPINLAELDEALRRDQAQLDRVVVPPIGPAKPRS